MLCQAPLLCRVSAKACGSTVGREALRSELRRRDPRGLLSRRGAGRSSGVRALSLLSSEIYVLFMGLALV